MEKKGMTIISYYLICILYDTNLIMLKSSLSAVVHTSQ